MRSPPGRWARDGGTPSPATALGPAQDRQLTEHNPRCNSGPKPPCTVPASLPHTGIDGGIDASSQVTTVDVPAQRVDATGPMVDNSPTRAELLGEVHRLVHGLVRAVRTERGPIPGVGTSAWWGAPPDTRIAGLLVLAEAWLITNPDRMAREHLKAFAADLSGAHKWREAAQRPSYVELQRRRRWIP